MRTHSIPVIHRTQPDSPLGASVTFLGGSVFQPANSYFIFAINEANVIAHTQNLSGSSPVLNIARLATPGVDLRESGLGYRGCWGYHYQSSGSGLYNGEFVFLFFTKSSTALVLTAHPSGTALVNRGTITMTGLPSGFDTTHICGTMGGIFAIVNNGLYFAPEEYGFAFVTPAFTQVSNTQVNAVTTKTKLTGATYSETISSVSRYFARVVMWGTAPANQAAYYDGRTNIWRSLVTPANHSGAANCFAVWPNGMVGFYNPSTGRFYTCQPAGTPNGAAAANWTEHYTTTTNRRLMLVNGIPCFLPTGASASYIAEAWPNEAVETVNVRGGSLTWPTEYLTDSAHSWQSVLRILGGTVAATGAAIMPSGGASKRTTASIFDDQLTYIALTELSLQDWGTGSTAYTQTYAWSAIPTARLGPSANRFVHHNTIGNAAMNATIRSLSVAIP